MRRRECRSQRPELVDLAANVQPSPLHVNYVGPVQLMKWQDYYDCSFLPWDTQRPSSQLVAYLTGCPLALQRSAAGDEVLDSPGSTCNVQPSDGDAPPRYHSCQLCSHLKPPAATPVSAAEFACGTGASCVFMAQVFGGAGRVVGVDLVAAAVAAARSRAEAAGLQGSCAFLQADVFSLLPPAEEGGAGWGAAAAWARAQQQQQQQQDISLPGPSVSSSSPAESQQQQQQLDSLQVDQPHGAQAHTGADTQGLDDGEQPTGFDFLYDCQAFHALRDVDEAGYLALLHRSLRPGGLLFLLTGNANEPAMGPATLTRQELLAAFCEPQWELLFLVQTRFDATPAYEEQGRLPLAWWGLFRRR